jgi:Fe-S-cluster-containing dehydrogenase component
MTKQLGFYVDAKRCIGCFTCAMACKNQYHQENGVVWRQVYALKTEIYPHTSGPSTRWPATTASTRPAWRSAR